MNTCERCNKPMSQHGWGNGCPVRDTSDLTPQLTGLEGMRVEVVTDYGETRRFYVGKSTGWRPIHLEIARRNSTGGIGAEKHYASIRTLYRR